MPFIIPANSASASGGYNVDNSLRFNPASNDRLTRTPSSSGNRLKWTWSGWAKRGTDNQDLYLFSAYQNSSYNTWLKFASGGEIRFADVYNGSEQARINTFAKFRDLSAWHHIVVVYDKNNSTSTDRLIIYVNGVRITQFDGSTMPTQSTTYNVDGIEIQIGALNGDGDMNGYISEVCFIDNQALAPTSFGEFDEDSGIWKPIDGLADLTFGTNGYYLEFKQAGTGTNASGMGADTSGNNHHFAVVNLTAVDQSTDTCTNNFATLNSLNNYWSQATFSEGNSVYTSNNTGDYYGVSQSTIGVSKGKWYFEAKNSTNTNQGILGITSRNQTGRSTWLGSTTQAYGYYSTGGTIRSSASDTSYGASYTANDIIGIYLDLDNNLMYVSDNGSLQNSGTGHAITAAASTDSGFYHFAVGDNSDSTQVWQCNFGGTSGFAISSGNTDDNGYGNFEYSPNITGDSVAKKFYALCTKNLAEFG